MDLNPAAVTSSMTPDCFSGLFQLHESVRRVDVDQDGADARGRKLRQQPFGAVRRPDADAVAAPHSQRPQAGGHRFDLIQQLLPGEAHSLIDEDRRDALGPAARGGGQQRVRCRIAQRDVGRAAHLRQAVLRHSRVTALGHARLRSITHAGAEVAAPAPLKAIRRTAV